MAELTDEQKVMRNATGQYIGDQVKLLRYLLAGGLPDGGADGQLLRKKGSEDYSLEWYTPNYAPNDSPALAGTPTAPTAASGTNSTQLATTAFVQQEKHLGITGASVGDLIRVGAVDANGKPTSWEHVPLYPSNENLLDNWYFVGGGSQLGDGVFPINQRGQQNYSGAVYGADRWRGDNSSSSATLQEDGLHLGQVSGASNYGRLRQELDFRAGLSSVVTFSAILKNSNGGFLSIYDMTTESAVKIADSPGASGATNGDLLSVTATIPANVTKLLVRIQSGSVQSDSCVIVAAKLELGSYQTLAHQDASGNWMLNELPNYDEELAKCQRYLVVTKAVTSYRVGLFNANGLYFSIPLPQPLAKVPAVSNIAVYKLPSAVQAGFSFSYHLTGYNALRVVAVKDNHGLTDASIVLAQGAIISAE